MAQYSSREVFLVSDRDWKEVLPLVPVTTWTGAEKDCTRGYGTAENVCVYPTLVWHDESDTAPDSPKAQKPVILGKDSLSVKASVNSLSNGKELTIEFPSVELLPGKKTPLLIKIKNTGNNKQEFVIVIKTMTSLDLELSSPYLFIEKGSSSFIISPSRDQFFALYPGDLGEYTLEVALNGETDKKSFDADSIIYFMQKYQKNNLEQITVVGRTLQELDNLLVAEREAGVGIAQDKIKRISSRDYLSYWKSYKNVVYAEDNYEIVLLASTYASLINAPLVIKGTLYDVEDTFAGIPSLSRLKSTSL